MRLVISLSLLLATTTSWAASGLVLPTAPGTDRASEIHRAAIVTDMHVDSLWQMHKKRYRFDRPRAGAQVDPKRLLRGGVDAQFFAIWMPPDTQRAFALADEMIDLFEAQVLSERPCIRLATSAREVVRLNGQGCISALLGIEGAAPLEGRPENIRHFAERGVRYMSLTWNETNPFADGAKARSPRGITHKGRRLVRLLNEQRVMVDVSHASRETFWDVVTESRMPVIATHSNANSIFPHARNLDDAQLWAIRESGGVVGLNFHGGFLHKRSRNASLSDVTDHARHIIQVAGIETVGLGTDFDGNIRAPRGLGDAAALPALTHALAKQGYAGPELLKLLGHNILRVLHETNEGRLRYRVRHRPMTLLRSDVSATTGGTTARLAIDHDATTAWRFDARRLPATLTLRPRGSGLGRVSICGGTTVAESGVARVRVTVTAPGVAAFTTIVELDAGSEVVPTSIELPAELQRARNPSVRVEVHPQDFNAQVGEPILAEVLAERCVKACP